MSPAGERGSMGAVRDRSWMSALLNLRVKLHQFVRGRLYSSQLIFDFADLLKPFPSWIRSTGTSKLLYSQMWLLSSGVLVYVGTDQRGC